MDKPGIVGVLGKDNATGRLIHDVCKVHHDP